MDKLSFIWDLDGTLTDSYPAIIPAAQEILAGAGIVRTADELYTEMIRSSVGSVLERLAAEHSLDPVQLKRDFNRLNDGRIGEIRPMPHAAETLAALQRAGHRSFVFTHRGASCPAILAQTGLASYFSEVLTALSGFPRKPAPDGILYLMEKHALSASRCCYVGDRGLDIEAANNAGIDSILYLPPGSPVQPTGREGHIVRDLLEIPALAARCPFA